MPYKKRYGGSRPSTGFKPAGAKPAAGVRGQRSFVRQKADLHTLRVCDILEQVLRTGKEKKESIMKTVSISLNSIDKVKSFVNDLTKFDDDFDLVSGRYVIDAKSIMGIFSLDLSRPIDLNIHATENMDQILKVLDPYIIK